jgi:Ca-activated chloride channel homolog
MKNLSRFIVFTVLMSAFSLAAFAQDDDPVSVFEVRLPITVEKKNTKKREEKLVKGLTKDDFLIFEDGVQQEVTFFTDEKTNPPIYVGVLMDTSISTKGKLGFSKEAAGNFLHTVIKLRKDKAAFMTFDHRIELHQDFTDKLDLLTGAVDKIKDTGSQTALYDAIWQFTDEKLRTAPGRRVIVIITDGEDTFSRAELEDAIDIAQRTETTIFAISTKEGFLGSVPGVEAGTVKDKGDKYLERLCEETGGRAFFTGDMLALEKSFTEISKEIHSQYIVTYRPANQEYDGRERKREIEVRFKNRDHEKKFKIRTKKEYRAIKDNL